MNRHALDEFCHQYPLSPAAVREVLALSHSQPSPAEWRGFAAMLLQRLGAAVMVVGGLMVLGWAWQEWSANGRLGLLQLALIACLMLARSRPTPLRGSGLLSLLMAMGLLAGLLAGLNAWSFIGLTTDQQLLAWLLLALPLAWAARCALPWVVWCAVLNMTVVLWMGTFTPSPLATTWWGGLAQNQGVLLMMPCLLNVGMAAVFAGLANSASRPEGAVGLVRMWVGLGFAYGCLACVMGILSSPDLAISEAAVAVVVAFTALWLTTGWAAWQQQDDVFVMALLATSFMVVSTTGVAKMLSFNDPTAWVFLALWVMVGGLLMAALAWGQRQQTTAAVPTPPSSAQDGPA